MDYDDLVKRLQAAQVDHNAWRWGWVAEASDAIIALQVRVVELEAENAQILADPMNVGWQRAQDAIKDRAAAVSQWKAYKQRAERAEASDAAWRILCGGKQKIIEKLEADLAAKDTTLGEMTALARKAEADLAAARARVENLEGAEEDRDEYQRQAKLYAERCAESDMELAAARALLLEARGWLDPWESRQSALRDHITAALREGEK